MPVFQLGLPKAKHYKKLSRKLPLWPRKQFWKNRKKIHSVEACGSCCCELAPAEANMQLEASLKGLLKGCHIHSKYEETKIKTHMTLQYSTVLFSTAFERPFSVWLHSTWFGLGLDRNWLAQARQRTPRWRVEMKLAVGLWPLLLAAWPCTAVVLEKPAQHKRLLPKGLLRPYIGGWEQQGCTSGLGTRSIQRGTKMKFAGLEFRQLYSNRCSTFWKHFIAHQQWPRKASLPCQEK